MTDLSEHCQELLDEYKLLRRRLEEDEFTNPDIDDPDDTSSREEDRDRLEEIREELEDECDLELPDDEETDIDLPEYAEEAPSEPMDFDAE